MQPSLVRFRVAFLAIGTTMILAVLISFWFAGEGTPYWGVSVVVGLLVAVVSAAYGVASFIDRTEDAQTVFGHLDVEEISMQQVEMLVSASGLAAMDRQRLSAFATPILHPERAFQRISESVTSYHRSVVVKSTFSVSHDTLVGSPPAACASGIATSDQVDFLIPLIVPPRGQLMDGLRVYDGNDKRVSTVSARRLVMYGLASIRGMIAESDKTILESYINQVEPRVVEMLCSHNPPESGELSELILDIHRLASGDDIEVRLRDVDDLITALARLNPVCAVLPAEIGEKARWPATHRFRVEHRFVPEYRRPANAETPDWWLQLLDAVRMFIGVRPNRLYFPLLNAARTSSYHLEVNGPAGTYLARQDFLPSSQHVDARVQRRRGQRRAHVQIRRIQSAESTAFATQFVERSPGSFALTSASALAAAVVIAILGWRQLHGLFNDNSLLPGLLAIPIGVAALAGLDSFQAERHPSLLSRLVSISTVASCLFAFGLATLRQGLPFSTDSAWMVLTGVVTALACISLATWGIRLAVELRLTNRGDRATIGSHGVR